MQNCILWQHDTNQISEFWIWNKIYCCQHRKANGCHGELNPTLVLIICFVLTEICPSKMLHFPLIFSPPAHPCSISTEIYRYSYIGNAQALSVLAFSTLIGYAKNLPRFFANCCLQIIDFFYNGKTTVCKMTTVCWIVVSESNKCPKFVLFQLLSYSVPPRISSAQRSIESRLQQLCG